MPSAGTGGSTHLPCPLAPCLSAPTPPPPPGAGAWRLLAHGRLWVDRHASRGHTWVTTNSIHPALSGPSCTQASKSQQIPQRISTEHTQHPSRFRKPFVDVRLVSTTAHRSDPPPPPFQCFHITFSGAQSQAIGHDRMCQRTSCSHSGTPGPTSTPQAATHPRARSLRRRRQHDISHPSRCWAPLTDLLQDLCRAPT
jgi:hypothetical protein